MGGVEKILRAKNPLLSSSRATGPTSRKRNVAGGTGNGHVTDKARDHQVSKVHEARSKKISGSKKSLGGKGIVKYLRTRRERERLQIFIDITKLY